MSRMLFLKVIIWFFSGFFCLIAVRTDTYLHHIRFRNIISIIMFFGNFPATIIYFSVRKLLPQKVPIVCTQCGKPQKKNQKTCSKCGNHRFAPLQLERRSEKQNKVFFCLALAGVVALAGYWLTHYSPLAQSLEDSQAYIEEYACEADEETTEEIVFYDRDGNACADIQQLPYYDENGKIYYVCDDGITDENGNCFAPEEYLVSSEGYIVSTMERFGDVPNVIPFQMPDGIRYFYAKDVCWNENGEMIYTSNGNPLQ